MSSGLIIGVDIGGTKIACGLSSLKGEAIYWDLEPTGAQSGKAIDHLFSIIHRTLAQGGKQPIEGIGIACAGLIDSGRGVVITSPNLPGWVDFPLKEKAETEFGIKTFVINDANAAALGEYAYGAGKGYKDIVYFTVSTGIGGGIILGGKLYSGYLGTAGEVGHMTIEADGPRCACGNRGCLEALASGSAIAREAVNLISAGIPTAILEMAQGKVENVSAELVHKAAKRGDARALEIIDKAASYFGIGLANVVNIFNPELIIVGGGVAKMGELFLGRAAKVMRERAFAYPAGRVRLCPTQLWEKAAIFGLIAYFKEL